MSHLWQRFLMASALLVGLAIGVGATVFGYSNLATVDVHWSVWHLDGVPLWAVAIVPIALILAAGTLYHWIDGLHHFSEHMRHRHRVRELEAEVTRLREHLDHVLEMPRGDVTATPAIPPGDGDKAALPPAGGSDLADLDKEMDAAEPAADPEPAVEPVADAALAPATVVVKASDRKKRPKITLDDTAAKSPEPATNGAEKVAAGSTSSSPEA